MTEDYRWIRDALAEAFTPKDPLYIDEWVDKVNFMLPSNSAEAGKYNIDRTPYQREVLRAMSPDHPAKTITLDWGSQTGKTTTEETGMCYYTSEVPSPIGFAFSDGDNLKNFVKNKFNPLLNANPSIKNLLKGDGRTSGDTTTLKTFPGGFIKFLSGRSEASLRSDSLRIVFADEVDGMEVTKGGDLKSLLQKRQNTFKTSSKLIMSSTPKNESVIYKYLQESTFHKYFMPCPRCGEELTFEQDYLRWSLDEGKTVVVDAWMECPHCKGRISNEDKVDMLPQGKWKPTNPKADPTDMGFKLPSFYAPVGWLDWKDIAKEWVTAYSSDEEHREDRMTAYYNTILAEPYIVGSNSQEWRAHYDNSLSSEYRRGQIPSWVNVLTTGADVQGNRIEISLYGWGRLGRSLAIDHWEIPTNEIELDTQGSPVWATYFETTLNASFEREDGLKMRTAGNALDSSYKTNACFAFWQTLSPDCRKRMFLFRGRDSLKGYRPNLQFNKHGSGLSNVEWYQVPVSDLKRALFHHLEDSLKDHKGEIPAFYMEFPKDYTPEYYQQLFSEAWVKEKKKWMWKKTRDRNEILDCTVYNLCLLYAIGLGDWSSAQWDRLAEQQQMQLTGGDAVMVRKRKTGRRTLFEGVKI